MIRRGVGCVAGVDEVVWHCDAVGSVRNVRGHLLLIAFVLVCLGLASRELGCFLLELVIPGRVAGSVDEQLVRVVEELR